MFVDQVYFPWWLLHCLIFNNGSYITNQKAHRLIIDKAMVLQINYKTCAVEVKPQGKNINIQLIVAWLLLFTTTM